MSSRSRSLVAFAVVALLGCDESFESEPRVTPAGESLWLLVGLQLRIDQLRAHLAAHPGKSFSPEALDPFTKEVVSVTELLTAGTLNDDQLRAARYRVDLVAVAWGLIHVDAVASAGGIGGSVHSSVLRGLDWIAEAAEEIRRDPDWPVKHPRESNRALLSAVAHRDNARASIPYTKVMAAGVHAATLTSGAISAVQLARAGYAGFSRLISFLEGAQGPGMLGVAMAGGQGTVQLMAAGKALALSTEEVIALASAGAISATALAVYMAASDLHHICTSKNWKSDRQGGPWTPEFEKIFKQAGMTLNDPANMVKVKAHRGPHPKAYHQEVFNRLRDGTKGIKPGTEQYREALKRVLARLAKEIQTPGTRLNQLLTGAVRE